MGNPRQVSGRLDSLHLMQLSPLFQGGGTRPG